MRVMMPPRACLYRGNCLTFLAEMPDNSYDSAVLDPPYGLGKPPPIEDVLRAWLDGGDVEVSGGGFMGKEWDSFVPGPRFWRELYRVLKPGAFAVVFAGQRTVDVMGISLRLGGFEVRDLIGWMYWNGFPKSMDVSTAIDAMDAKSEARARALRCTRWVRSTRLTPKQIDELTDTNMGSHYTTDKSQPAVLTPGHLDALRPWLARNGIDVPGWLEEMIRVRLVESENVKAREVVGTKNFGPGSAYTRLGATGFSGHSVDSLPHTDAARLWQGFGTALKPCIEPALLVRKPLEGTYAENVTKWGAGALNIDGCRYPFGDPAWPGPQDGDTVTSPGNAFRGHIYGEGAWHGVIVTPPGRWPANAYYCPKASTKERERGCDGLEVVGAAELVDRTEGSAGMANPQAGAGGTSKGRRNSHPTVKSVRLMRWLCRLVTPPGGKILDMFAGSGSCGVAATLEGFRYTGCELEDEYFPILSARVRHAERHPEQWVDTTPGPPVSDEAVEEVELEAAGQVGLFGAEL